MKLMGIVVCVAMIATFVSIIVVVLYWWSNRKSLVTNWPVLGMLPRLVYNYNINHVSYEYYDSLTYLLQKSNGTFMFKGPWFCGMDFLFTSDPMNVHHTLSKTSSNYLRGADFNQIFDYFGDGILNVESDSWRIQRNMIHSMFKDKHFELAHRTSIHNKVSKGLFSILDHACESGNQVDLKDMFQRFSFDNICLLVFGMDPNALSKESPHLPFEKAFGDIVQVIFYRHIVPGFIWKLQRWLQIGMEKKMTKAYRTFDDFVCNCIQEKQQQLQQKEKKINHFEFDDALTYFLQVENSESNKKFIRDIAVTLLGAGRETISASLSWTFWLIGMNPCSEKKILQEMEQHLGMGHNNNNDKYWRFFDFEKMEKLVYLHGVICEALRLYPPIPFNHKASIKSDVLPSGHHISRNTRILYSFYSMGRMKDIWGEDCLEFKPERWISESGGIKHYPSYKFIAFGSGPRTCLGKDMSFLSIKAVVCAILRNYSLQLIEEDQHASPATAMVLHMKNDLKARVFKRNAC